MSPSKCFKRGEWIFRIISSVYGLIIFTTGVSLGQPAWAGGVVASCTESALRVTMAGGGTVNFACDGTITLASTITNTVDAVLDGSGHQVTISGNNAVRVFYVATNVNFTVVNLTIAGGQSTDGAGVFNSGGMPILSGTTCRTSPRTEVCREPMSQVAVEPSATGADPWLFPIACSRGTRLLVLQAVLTPILE